MRPISRDSDLARAAVWFVRWSLSLAWTASKRLRSRMAGCCPGKTSPLKSLQRRSLGRPTGITAVIVSRSDQGPSRMGLTPDIGLRGIMLGVQRVEVLLKPMLGRHAGVDGASNRFGSRGLHGRASDDGLSRRPKNLGPFQREPVIAKATLDRLGYVVPFQLKPSASTMTRCK